MSFEAPTTGRRTLMVVDDDSAIREVIQTIIESEGYPVVTAGDGLEALGQLRTGLRPGVILLDLRMPGMDGRAFREAQRADPTLVAIPTVIISGDREAHRVAASLESECILKPIDLDQLLSIAERFCGDSPLNGKRHDAVPPSADGE